MNIYEIYGREVEAHALAVALGEHHRTLKLLSEIKSGEIDLKRVTVNNEGWSVEPLDESVAGKVG